MLDLPHGAVRTKIKDIKLAVNGRLSTHQRDFLKMLADWYETCREHIGEAEKEMMACAEKYRETVELVHAVPGIQEISAITVISEVGVNLSMFPSVGHFCSWADICP